VDFMDSEYPSFPHPVTTPSADTLLSPGYETHQQKKLLQIYKNKYKRNKQQLTK